MRQHMHKLGFILQERAVCRAAPKPARIPLGDRLRFTADEGQAS
jgi:hypothetical protein